MIRHFLLYSAILSTPLITHGQTNATPDVPPPQAPFVAEVPTNAQWTITLKYGKEPASTNTPPATSASAPAPNRLQQLRISKLGNLKRDVSVQADGGTSEAWYVDNITLTTDSEGQNVMVGKSGLNDPHYGERGNPLMSTGFTGVSWIKEKYYDKPVRFQKEICYHYVLKTDSSAPAPAVENDPSVITQSAGAEAWVSVKTNLPVAYRFDDVLYSYEFDAPPTSLKMPSNFQAKYDLYKQLIGR